MFSFSVILAAIMLAASGVAAKNGGEPLNHYTLIGLRDEAVGQRLAARFKAKGKPVFLVHDLATGLTQGDIMRFQDKAALIDADIWQTLQAEGALEKLQTSPLVRVTAKGSEATWAARAKQMRGAQEQMAYLLGAELIKVLQENFGGLPGREQFLMTFDGANLQLLAPREFLDQLKVVQVVKAPATGRPRFISPGPRGTYLAGDGFFWQPMAVDPADPDGDLRYQVTGKLPPGLLWNAEIHALQGRLETPGIYVIAVEVRNRQGASATLEAKVEILEDKPPMLAQIPKAMAFTGQAWSFAVLAADPDHPGDSLRIHPGARPPSMAYDSSTRTFSWTPPDSLADTQTEFAFRLSDPLGKGEDYRFPLQVRKGADLALTQGIRLDLPFDTLIRGKTYAWRADHAALVWADQGIALQGVIGPDSTRFENGLLTLRPMRAGSHNVLFNFTSASGSMQQARSFVVLEDKPPRFLSALSTGRIAVGQASHYLPIAVDPEGETVSLQARIPEGSDMRFEAGRLRLEGAEPGMHAAQLLAFDPSGHVATQWIAIEVDPAARPRAWTLENRVQGGIATWTASVDFGSGRLGFYTPALPQALSFTRRSGREWPYLFFGGNLLGHRSELRGNRLFTDLGFTLRLPDPKVATGGVYGRISGEWSFPKLGFSRVETEFTGHVRQALVLTDTTGVRLLFGEDIFQLAGRYDPIARRIIDDATAKDNAAFFTRIEAYSRFGFGFFGGPGAWREDFPMDQRFYQRVGGVLRYQARWRALIGQWNIRSGWGPGGAGWDIYATWRASWGAPF